MPALRPSACVLVLLVAFGVGCDVSSWLRASGSRSFRELSPEEAWRLLDRSEALLVWLGPPSGSPAREGSVTLEDPGSPLDASLAGAAGPVVVLGEDESQNLRLAARLARSGIEDVAVVRGGAAAWRTMEARVAAKHPAGS